jgi:hypothetical protein
LNVSQGHLIAIEKPVPLHPGMHYIQPRE